MILQKRALGDDGAGDLDFIERQHGDEGGRGPFGGGEAVGQGLSDIAFGLAGDDHEDLAENGRCLGAGRGRVAQGRNAKQQTATIVHTFAARELKEMLCGGQGLRVRGAMGLKLDNSGHGELRPDVEYPCTFDLGRRW